MVSRRDALKGFAGAALAVSFAPACSRKDEVPPPSDPVFGHGVASGDPLPNAVILWTRISTTAPTAEGKWQVAEDPGFTRLVTEGTFTTNADRDHTVKVDATGLKAGTTYFYRFLVPGRVSMIGRTRTAPEDSRELRFAVVSCASLPHGYFHAYRAIAARGDIDAVIHLGDYIYEYADGDYGKVRKSEPEHAVQTLADYRERYGQYRRDHDLQEAHRQHPFICIWDDHEYVDNAFHDGATGDNGALTPDRRTAAAQAYSEWIPIRDQDPGKIWRALHYGAAELFLLDTRIWGRDIQLAEADPKRLDAARQILGADQEKWLADSLRTSTASWKLVCQQVMMTSVPTWFRDDGWDDYPAARDRFYDILEKTPVKDVVVLSGDVHSSWACELARTPEAEPLAVELIAPAISSPGPTKQDADAVVADAPWIKFAQLGERGFILLDANKDRVRSSWIYVANVEEEATGGTTRYGGGYATSRGMSRLVKVEEEPGALIATPLAPNGIET